MQLKLFYGVEVGLESEFHLVEESQFLLSFELEGVYLAEEVGVGAVVLLLLQQSLSDVCHFFTQLGDESVVLVQRSVVLFFQALMLLLLVVETHFYGFELSCELHLLYLSLLHHSLVYSPLHHALHVPHQVLADFLIQLGHCFLGLTQLVGTLT